MKELNNLALNNVSDVWDAVLDIMRNKFSETVIQTWLAQLEPTGINIELNTFNLKTTSEFKRNIVVEKFKDDIDSALEELMGFKLELNVFVYLPEKNKKTQSVRENETDVQDELLPEKKLSENTFETFIEGPTNTFAYTAARAVAKRPGLIHNPLFIYGNSGLGKTHLLKAIKNEISQTIPRFNILYTSGENFMNEMIAHLSEKNMSEFHKKYRNADILLMDDIQFIGKSQAAQEEFFYTFEALINDGKQIVLVSDRPPKDIQQLEERLRSRFVVGLLADIQPPMIETRIAIIKNKAKFLEMNIPDDVVRFIAERLKNNVRQIEGVVKKIHAIYTINGETPTIETADKIIKDIIYYAQPAEVTVNKIIDSVAKVFGVSSEDIRSERKKSEISNARQVAMYIIRETTNLTYEEIGNFFGGKKHSTVIYSIEAVDSKKDDDSDLNGIISDIIKDVRNEEN